MVLWLRALRTALAIPALRRSMKAERGFVFRILRKRSLVFWERAADRARTARLRQERRSAPRRRYQRWRSLMPEERRGFAPATPRINQAAEDSQRVAISEVCAMM